MANCKHCRKKFTQKTFNLRYCCETEECREACARYVLDKKKSAIEKQTKKRENSDLKEKKEKLKTLSQYEAEAKKEFQKYIRFRDKDLPCISCGTKNCNEWAGGHYFKAEIYSGLIFDERNCHKQCNAYCNKYRDGAQAEYRIGLVNRFGDEFVKQLELDSIRLRNYKYTKQQLIEIKEHYKELNKQFKQI